MDSSISPKPVIDFWFEFGSNYSYLSVMRIEREATLAGVDIRWQPFLLGPIFQSFGWSTSPFVLQKEKGRYTWRDMERQCRRQGIPWVMPTRFPRPAILPLRVALLGVDEPWMAGYCRRVMTLNFARDQDIDSPEAVGAVLDEMGLPREELLARAVTDANKLRLREQTERARALGIFGAPTFFVGDEMFWGNDRLDEALEFCVRGA